MLDASAAAPKPGILYADTRAAAEELPRLSARGGAARAYHAGLAAGERETTQQAFVDDDREVIVATTAFGTRCQRRARSRRART